ncbi:MAG: LpxD N-terminal domain-containing protein, partial [Verrucomicrobiota bacterium]|nr:LpxD N-terminal domain-containing protein [Verrucomicrobiota bacterium]
MVLNYSIKRIIEILGKDCQVVGAYDGSIRGIASLTEAESGDLSFLGNPKYRPKVADSQASVILIPTDYEETPEAGQLYLKIKNPSFALALICRDIEATLLPKPSAGVHPSAVIEPDAEVSPDASIGAFCYIGPGAKVGASVLESHVTLGHAAVI